ncbi:MAG: phage terminase large subunit family protein [Verrucomicrobiaceae bacterium]|nr:phage terminase large subunit family protein [Verrucomicrobiaceae bacterium]
MNNLPGRLAQKILNVSDFHEAEELIAQEVNVVLKTLQNADFLEASPATQVNAVNPVTETAATPKKHAQAPAQNEGSGRQSGGPQMTALQVRPVQRMWEWIDEHVVIPQVIGSLNPGPLDTSLMPFWRGIYDAFWSKKTHFLTLACSARVGKTLFCICCVLHKKGVWPGPVLWVDPTGKTAKAFSRTELQAHIMECRPVADKAIIDKTHWTTLLMHFTGSVLRLVGGGSVADLAGYQAEMVILNETDKTKHNLKGEAATQDLALARTKQFRFTRKILENSTPTTEWGRIWSRFKAGSQEHVYLPCPHCGHKQRLTFFADEKEVPFDEEGKPLPAGTKRVEKTGRFKFDHLKREDGSYDLERVERETVYECACCQKTIDQSHQAWMLRRYELRAHNPAAPVDHRSFHIWAALSPFEGWGMIAKEFLLARGSISRMHNFTNSTLGLPFVRKDHGHQNRRHRRHDCPLAGVPAA